MYTSEAKVTVGITMAQHRPVLQPTCNRVPPLERRSSVKKPLSLLPPPTPTPTPTPPQPSALNRSCEKLTAGPPGRLLDPKKSKSFKGVAVAVGPGDGDQYAVNGGAEASLSYSSALITESPGSIAAVRREQMALHHAQRKMRITHYGRSKSATFERHVAHSNSTTTTSTGLDLVDHHQIKVLMSVEVKRCSFITPNSDPIYVAYHDQEWGIPVHDDKMLFELLVLSGAQVGSDWTSILKKREEFREAFSHFEAESVATFTDKHMLSITSRYAIDISRVRGVIDNSIRILEIKKDFGTFDKYIWGFVNHKPISTQYKSGQRIPVKTSKSETISKDLVRRGFRFVGPTVVHSFMQAAGLTNDHLTTCHRHLRCTADVAAESGPYDTSA